MLKKGRSGFRPCATGGIANDLLERGEIFKIASAAGGGDPADSLRSVAVVASDDLDYFGPLEDTEVSAEIAIGQGAKLLEIVEGQALGIGDERSEDAEACPLVDYTIQTFVGVSALCR